MAEIFAVISGKGGVGKSTITAGLSKALAGFGKKVLAVDCDIGLRSLDLLLDCDSQIVFDWGDAIAQRCSVQRAIIEGEVDFAAAPRNDDDAFNAESLRWFLDEVSDKYDYIFLDAPAGLGKGFMTAVGAAERALAVTTPDGICVRSCALAVMEAQKLKKDSRLIINMFEARPVKKRKLLNLDECVDETRTQLLGVVPMDRALAFASVTGTEPGEFSSSSQAFERIAKRLTGEKTELICE